MQEGTTHIDVALLATHQQHYRKTVDKDADACRPRYGDTIDLDGVAELQDALIDDASYGSQQQDGVDQ